MSSSSESSRLTGHPAAMPQNADQGSWLTTSAFAEITGLTRQAACRALKSALNGSVWRGHRLEVRPCLARGGRRGFAYEVAQESLPPAYRLIDAIEGGSAPTPSNVDASEELILGRWHVIKEIVRLPRSSAERARAVETAALSGVASERTLYRWIDRYEANGLRGLGRAKAANANEPRIWVSRTFDRHFAGAGYPTQLHNEITRELEKALKGLWASRAEHAGSTEVRRLAEFMLTETCESRGVRLPPEAMRLSRRYVEQFAHYRVVNQRRNDRKAFHDAKPRIRRDWTMLAPMERVIADVKHLDVIVTREDGSTAWPKIVAFMDAGTGRTFVYPLLLKVGEGVRQEHVIEAFLAMVAHPRWGFPQGLYLDNGSEFAVFTKITGPLQQINQSGARTLLFARPYNAAAKPIESLFARLDRYVFSMLPGYAGPNRMAKKTQTQGKPPTPFPGPWDEFRDTVIQLISAHNQRPVGGLWAGRSPEDWMQEKVTAGWRPARVDPEALDAAFSDSDSRRVDRGVLKIGGRCYSHPRISALPSRTVVDLALPWRRGAAPLARVKSGWFYLEEEKVYPARWNEGARESGRRQTAQLKHVRVLAADAPLVDPIAIKLRAAKRPRLGVPIGRGPVMDLGGFLDQRADGVPAAEVVQSTADVERQRKIAREMHKTEQLERRQRGDD
jgi:hypothetical protein